MPDTTPHDDVDPEVARRLTAAFGALATTEVPSSAPRPAGAPRPAASGPRVTRRRLGLAGGGVLVAAAAVVVALVVGGEVQEATPRPSAPAAVTAGSSPAPAPDAATTSVAPTASGTPTTPGAGPTTGTTATAAEVTAAFAAVAWPTRSAVVAVGSRYQAADLADGTIRFWIWHGSSWTVAGTSTYPPDVTAGTGTSYTATISAAALLTGMDVATFVVTGDAFTGDSTGSTIAYTAGPTGWGVVKAGADGLLHPSGEGFPALGSTDAANAGLSYAEALVDGLLETVDCSTTSPSLAACGQAAYQVVKYWRWDGVQFALDHRTGPAS